MTDFRLRAPRSLVCSVEHHASTRPNAIAFEFLGAQGEPSERLTYAELDRAARRIACLVRESSSPGDRTALLFAPGLDFVKALVGALYAGLIVVPLVPPLPHRARDWDRVRRVVRDSGARVVLTDVLFAEGALAELRDSTGTHHQPSVVVIDPVELPASFARVVPEPDDVAIIQYTSGSTGTPKGVVITHYNLACNLDFIGRHMGYSAASQGVSWLPFYHDMGLIGGVLTPLYVGFPVALMSPLTFLQKPVRWLEAITTTRATTSPAPTFAYELCCKRVTDEQIARLDLRTWTVAINGAEPVRASVLDAFVDRFAPAGFRRSAIRPCYGMAEATLMVTGLAHDAALATLDVDADQLSEGRVAAASARSERRSTLIGCGTPDDGTDVRIVDPTRHVEVADGTIGEIWIAGPSVAHRYWGKAAGSEAVRDLGARLATQPDCAFLRTGDLGAWLHGQLLITGRMKELIIIRGRNHYPWDFEQTAASSHAATASAVGAAFSVVADGTDQLVIVQEARREAALGLDACAVAQTIGKAIIEEHGIRPHAVLIAKPRSLPRTTSGKIQRGACRELYLCGELDLVAPHPELGRVQVPVLEARQA